MNTKTTMSAAAFKNACLKVISKVAENGLEVVVTKRGKPMVRIVPVREVEPEDGLEGLIIHQDPDLLSTGEEWEADR